MRRRITAVLVAVMTLALTVLGVPLARSIAEGERQQLYVSRLADAARFASLAQQVETDVDLAVLRLELVRYEEVYGVPAAVLDRQGVPLAASRTPLVLGDGGAAAVAVALTGRRAEQPRPAPPLAARPLVVVEPVVVGGDVTSVVVTMSPTESLRERVLVAWVLLGAGMVAALLLCWALAVGLAGWVLRPVHALDEATQAVATGRLTARVPQTIGPPELRRLGGAFNDMAESVEALLAQQRTFVADASHQLRNPLSALLLRLDSVALAEPDLDVRLEPVRAEGRRLTEVLDELLQLARTEHATTVAVPVPLGPLVLDRDEAWQVVARRKGVLLDVHVHGDPVALAEATALSGAVDALLDNAIKFSPEGGAVALHAERTGEGVAGDGVVIRVRNRDDMLEETDVQRFGDRFWRAAGHQNVPGSGLGLAIVRVLADRWGGALEASRPGPGQLEVRLCLPAADRPGRARLGQPAVSR